MSHPPILLASSSPGRIASLKKIGVAFKTHNPDIDETPLANEGAVDLVKRLSIAKANTWMDDNDIVIAGDQVLEVDGTILSKPHTMDNAYLQLKQCSGKTVYSYSGMCVTHQASGYINYTLTTAKAVYRQLTDTDIERYLHIDNPLQCAGSIKFESKGFVLLESLACNDSFAICGLPLHQLVSDLTELGRPLVQLID